MSESLRTIAIYLPQSLVRAAIANPKIPVHPHVQRFPAAVLFTDVSGFTPLTEALAQKGSEGPEELTRLLNRYFSWMIAFIEAEGGEVIKFGGDSLTVLFSAVNSSLGEAARLALQTAETMQSTMSEFGVMESSVGLVSLRMKFGIGAGSLLMAQVGGVEQRWEYFIAGPALFQATQAERQAKQGQIQLSRPAQAVLVNQSRPVSAALSDSPDWTNIGHPQHLESVLRCYVPKPVLSWLDQKLHHWLATLRPMSVLFVGIKQLDYNIPQTIERLHRFVQGAQEIIYRRQGSLPRLTVDDKGTVLLILFGAPPYSHEDDAERAVRCALALQRLAHSQQLQLSIGVTTGRVFAGPVGGFTRSEYTVMGDTVNLAARLMVLARPGQIVCNYETYRSTYNQIVYNELPPVAVKGKSEPIAVYEPLGDLPVESGSVRSGVLHTPLVGRLRQLNHLQQYLSQAAQGDSRVVLLEGEAGIGKSRLVAELLRQPSPPELLVLTGIGRSIEQATPYHAWREVLATLLALEDIPLTRATISQLQVALTAIDPALAQYAHLLHDLFGQSVALNGADRHQKLIDLLLDLLTRRTQNRPTLLVLESAQWLDSESWDVAVHVAHAMRANKLPMLLLLVMRPLEVSAVLPEAAALVRFPGLEKIRLNALSDDEILAVVSLPVGLTGNELPEAVAELLRHRAGGNPFFVEELFYALHQRSFITFKPMQNKMRCLVNTDISQAAQFLPATIQNIVLARLDQLTPEKQLILKVAAVIGITFPYIILQETLTTYLDVDETTLHAYLADLVYLGLIQPEANDNPTLYHFENVIIREVTYQSVLFNRRRQIHRTVAEWYEQAAAANKTLPALPTNFSLDSFNMLLVYHWHQADDPDKERHYATLIGQQALAQYANAEALSYLERAINLISADQKAELYELLLAQITVFDRLGRREQQRRLLTRLKQLVEEFDTPARLMTVTLCEAEFAIATGNFLIALEAAEFAIDLARQLDDNVGETRSWLLCARTRLGQSNAKQVAEPLAQALLLAQTHHLALLEAEVLHQQAQSFLIKGDDARLKALVERSLQLCEPNGQHQLAGYNRLLLGQVEHIHGIYHAALKQYEQAMLNFYTVGYRRGEAACMLHMGRLRREQTDFGAARDYFEYALNLSRDINDPLLGAHTLAQLGHLYCIFGDYTIAQSYLGQSMSAYKDLGNLPGEGETLSQFGRLYWKLGDYHTALRYCSLALRLQRDVGNHRHESYIHTTLGHIFAGKNDWTEAGHAYRRALELLEGEHTSLVLAPLTGLAAANLVNGNLADVQKMVTTVSDWLNNYNLAGIDEPFWVYLMLYWLQQLLAADEPAADAAAGENSAVEVGQQQSQKTLAQAYAALKAQAEQLSHEKQRAKFLQKVPAHRDILTLWHNVDAPLQTALPLMDRLYAT